MKKDDLLILAIFLILTAVLTYPLIFNFNTSLVALSADPMINLWALSWNHYQWFHDPLNLFNANIYFPHSGTLAFSESLIASAIISLPVKIFTSNPITAYNFVFLFAFVFCAWGTYLFMNHIIDHKLIAFFAGAVFSFCSFKYHHRVQLQLTTIQWFPFALLFFHKYIKSKKFSHLLAGGFFYVLLALSSGYYALYALLLLGIMIPFYWWLFRKKIGGRFWLHLLITGLIIAILLTPFFYPYYRIKKEMNLIRPLREVKHFSCDVMDYLASESNIWGGLVKIQKTEPLFPGRIIIALLVISLFIGIKKGFSPSQKLYALMSLCAFIFSLGPILHFKKSAIMHLPYYLLYRYAPGFNGLRAPCLFGIFAIFGLIILSCYGLKEITSSYVKKWRFVGYVLVSLLTILVLAENVKIPMKVGKLNLEFPQIYTWLANQPGDFAIVELPLPSEKNIANNLRYMYYSTAHWKRLVNGCSGRHPNSYNKLRWALQEFPNRHNIRYLKEHYSVKYIILHLSQFPNYKRKEILAGILKFPNELHSVINFGSDYVIEVVNRAEGKRILREFPHYWLKGKNLQFRAKSSIKQTPKNILSIYLNGKLAKSFELTDRWRQYRLPITKSAIKYGINSFEFVNTSQKQEIFIIQDLELVK